MLEPAMFIGLGAVAVWAYVNYPRLRPGSLIRAVVHVIVAFVGFALLPALASCCRFSRRAQRSPTSSWRSSSRS